MRRQPLKNLPEENVFKELRSPVLNEGDLNGEESSGLKALSETFDRSLLAEEYVPGFRRSKEKAYHAEEMRFSRSEMALEKDAAAFMPGEREEDHLEAFRHLCREDEGIEDRSTKMGILQIFELNDRPDFRDFDEIANCGQG